MGGRKLGFTGEQIFAEGDINGGSATPIQDNSDVKSDKGTPSPARIFINNKPHNAIQ